MDIPLPSTTHHPSKFYIFMQIAMFLAVVTGIEIVIIFMPVPDFVAYSVLGVLSLVKFLAVIFYFMHLRWDKVFCTVLFFIGLLMGGGTLIALVTLFWMDRTSATADMPPLPAPPPAATAPAQGA
ncbi:MAG: cytochrome C oxidase subunit IV family protein [Opitutaceae bacterium]